MANPATPIRIMLVEPQQIVLWALETLIERQPAMEVVGKAGNGADAQRLASQVQPHIVLLDLHVDDGKGAELVPSLARSQCARIVIYTAARDLATVDRAIINGARGLVRKEESPETLLNAVRRVHAGELWFDHQTTRRIFAEFGSAANNASVDPSSTMIGSLTRKERTILVAFAKDPGSSNVQFAEKLFISEHTLRNHLSSIFAKLSVTGRCGLCSFVRLNGHQLLAN